MADDTVYTVSQLNRLAKCTIEDVFPRILVEGEISNFARPSSGHWYFTLKDERAQIRCAMFRGQNSRLRFTPEDGMHLLLKAKVSIYEGRGDYQLIVDHVEEMGDGALRRAFEALKKKLDAKSYFDLDRKKLLPEMIQTIGVITSPTGAALQDILSVIEKRFPAMHIIIYPTPVQGTNAHKHIVKAIKTANKRKECDALILVRGGGSLEDLWSFNEESVADAMVKSKLPIVSGIGHETDVTIADFVADVRAPTPSAAAETVTPDKKECAHRLWQLGARLSQLLKAALKSNSERLNFLMACLKSQHPWQQLLARAQTLDALETRLHHNIQSTLQYSSHDLARISQALNTLSPLATLGRGYSITSSKKSIITSTRHVNKGDTITTRVQDGEIHSVVR